MKNGTVRLPLVTNMRLTWRTSAVFSDLGADHDPGRVAQEQDRQVVRVAQLHEPRRLVRTVGVDRAGEMRRVVGDQPHRPAFDADERGDHADAELRSQLEHRVVVGEPVDDGAHVVDAQPVLGDDVPQRALVGTRPRLDRALEVRQVLLRRRHRFGFVLDGDVDDAVRHLHRHRSDVLGLVHAEAAAFDHRRTTHADVRVGGGDHDVAATEQRGVAREAAARVDADQRHEPAQRTPQRERHAVEAGDAGAVGVTRDVRRRPR